MKPFTPAELADLKAKAKAATLGPWRVRQEKDGQGYRGTAVQSASGLCVANMVMDLLDREQANATHIAASNPETILRLIDMIEQREASAEPTKREGE